VQFAAWRHFGEMTVKDDRGRSNTFFTCADLSGKSSAQALRAGMPTRYQIQAMDRTGLTALLLERDADASAAQLTAMTDMELKKKAFELYEESVKKAEDDMTRQAKKAREDANEEAKKLLVGIGGFGAPEVVQAEVEAADKNVTLHRQDMELLQSAGLSSTDIQALKATAAMGAKSSGVKLHSIRIMNEANNINPMMVQVEGDGAHLIVNIGYFQQMAEKRKKALVAGGMSESEAEKKSNEGIYENFLSRSRSHYLPHEYGHVFSSRKTGRKLTDARGKVVTDSSGNEVDETVADQMMAAVAKKYSDKGEGTDHTSLMRFFGDSRTRSVQRASSELISDMFVQDDQSLLSIYGDVHSQMEDFQNFRGKELLNAARISAMAAARAGKNADWKRFQQEFDQTIRVRVTGADEREYQEAVKYFARLHEVANAEVSKP
jgi:hypothetical protein